MTPAHRPHPIAQILAALSLLGPLALPACTPAPAGQRYYHARAVTFAPSDELTPPPAAAARAAHPGD